MADNKTKIVLTSDDKIPIASCEITTNLANAKFYKIADIIIIVITNNDNSKASISISLDIFNQINTTLNSL